MRKITSLIALLLLCAVTVSAQTTVYLANSGTNFTKGTASSVLPTTVGYGTFSGQTFTTAAASGLAGVTLTASSGLTIGEQYVNVNYYGDCFKFVTAAAATNYTVTLSAPDNYVITGYYLACSANTSNAAHTLTSEDGTVSVVASAPPYNSPNGPKIFEVTGLNTQTTSFTINTANNGNTLYVPVFTITLKDMSKTYVDVTYVVKDINGNTIFTSSPIEMEVGTNITTLPAEYQKTLFYTYNTVDETVSATNNTIEFIATPKSDAPFKFTADATNPTWYFLTIRPDNSANTSYPLYVAGGSPNVTLPATKTENEESMWAFIGNPYAGFQIINRAAGTSLVLGSASAAGDGANGGNTYATLAAANSQTYEVWTVSSSSYATGGFFISNAADQYLNRRSNANLAYWTGGHDVGSTFVATEYLEGEALFNAIITQIEAINWGTGVNQFQLTGSLAGFAGNEAALIAQLKTEGYSDENLAGAQAMLDNNALNLPAPGFYRIKGNTSGKYLANGNIGDDGTKYSVSTTADATTVFYFSGSRLVNLSTGKSVNLPTWTWLIDESALSAVAFQDGLTNGGYAISNGVNANSLPIFLYDNGNSSTPSVDRGAMASISTSTDARYTSWYLEEVTTLPLTLHDGQDTKFYATMSLPVDVTLTGATAYTATLSNDKTRVSFTELGDRVPANVPVLLIGTSEAATAAIADNDVAEPASNALVSSNLGTDISNDATKLTLGIDNNEVGFYMYDSALGGFRAYLDASGSTARSFAIVLDDEVTGIHAVNAVADGAKVYDLQGRRVSAAQKGVYIVNGKKVLVK